MLSEAKLFRNAMKRNSKYLKFCQRESLVGAKRYKIKYWIPLGAEHWNRSRCLWFHPL